MNKFDKELTQSIIGGEMRNAWQPTAPGEGKDERTHKLTWVRPSQSFRNNYDQIFGRRKK